MEELHKLHKDVAFGWVAWLKEALAKDAQARREHAIAVWGDGATVSKGDRRPDRLYRVVLTALATPRP